MRSFQTCKAFSKSFYPFFPVGRKDLKRKGNIQFSPAQHPSFSCLRTRSAVSNFSSFVMESWQSHLSLFFLSSKKLLSLTVKKW